MVDDDSERLRVLTDLNRRFEHLVPHNRALNLEVLAVEHARATFRLPYDVKLIGNPETGVLHGGAITAAMDAACGTAVFQALPRPMVIATLDLRIDYLKPATPPRDVTIRAHCYKVTRNVAFVRGVAFHDDESDPIASGAGSFMLGTRNGRREPEPE
jgi:uncharacterized protein (TIGR00369 family)